MKTLITTICFILLFAGIAVSQNNNENTVQVSVERLDGEITLTWSTQREINTSYFGIERSADGVHFERIASIKAQGSSMFPSEYEYSGIPDSDSLAVYRVVLVNMEGIARVFKPVSVNPHHLVNDSNNIVLK